MKNIFTCLLIVLGFNSFSQDLIITEISYNGPESGTDSTEYIELYNNSASVIDLTGYSLSSGVTHSFYPGETIAPGGYYVIAVDSMAVFYTFGYLPNAQFTGGLSNSGEAITIINGSGIVQDSVFYDDVAPWPTTPDGFGSTLALCDVTLDNNNGANWFASTTDAGIVVNGVSVFGSPGAEDAICSGPTAMDTTAIISTADMSVLENVGTIDITVTLNLAASIDKTVDLVLNIGNNAVVNGFTPQTITFTGGSTSETVTITVTPGQLGSASETLEFGLANAGTGLVYGADTLFNLTVNEMPPAIAPCSDLYFSEYIEGNSNNKALEIYNPTTGIIDLSNYEVRKYTNSSATVSSTISLSGLLIPGEVFVIANPNAFQVFLDQADLISGVLSHNGDDAYDLFNISAGVAIDQIGDIGLDPGASWSVGTGSTANNTLVRMATVNAGTSTWFGIGDQQWDVYPVDDSTHLGSHTNTSCTDPIPLTAYPFASSMEVCLGDTIWFTHNSFGGTSPINAAWEINAVQTITDTLEYVANTAGLITVSFGVMDGTMATDDSVFTILVNAPPVNGLTFDNNTVCTLDTANFTSTANGASAILTYSYSLLPSGVLMDSANGSGNGYVVPNTDGVFTLTQMVTDSLGCMSSSDYTVTSNPLDDATFAALANICSTDTIQLQNTNTTGVWSGSVVTDQTGGIGFAHGSAGVYDITYTTSGSCPDSHTESVEIYANPTASFTFTGSIDVSFNSTSTGGSTCFWDFGDGNTSTACAPTHTYAADGVYTVCLTSTNSNNCTDSVCQTVTIQGVGVKENAKNNFTFYPNPSEGNITITTSHLSTVQIVNIVGNIVSTQNINGTKTLDLSDLSKGSYFIKVTAEGKTETKKLILQ